jgi:hypothetical protein
MRTLRVAISLYLLVLLAVAAAGCGCTCRPASVPSVSAAPGWSSGVSPSAARPAYSASREPSYYERYKEEKHRRQVEKDLRDIKRNTQRPRLSK